MSTRTLPEIGTQYRHGVPLVTMFGGGIKYLDAEDARALAAQLNAAADRVDARHDYGKEMPVGPIMPEEIKAASAPNGHRLNPCPEGAQKGSMK